MVFFFFKQKTAYEMRISDWSSDVCSSDLNFAADGYDQGKGYGRNLTTGRDIHKQSYYSLRGKILWQPSGGTNVLLTASHNFAAGDTGLNTARLPGTVSVGGGVAVGRYNSTGGAPRDRSRDKEAAVTLKIDQDLGQTGRAHV